MKKFEINGNLDDEIFGLKNYDIFSRTICDIVEYYIGCFGKEYIGSIPLYVDNATSGSGYTPIITRTLDSCLIIKLNIEQNDGDGRIAYQFSHEMMHYIFFVKYGLHKELADEREEAICSAASLIVLRHLYPNDFEQYNEYTKRLSNLAYKNGADIAEKVGYDMEKLKEMI